MAYDDVHDEIVVPQPQAQAIMTFRGGANGEEPPIRVIQGSLTQLGDSDDDPDRLALDPVNHEIFVPQKDYILVFDRRANGNVAPLRILKGPDAFRRASAVAVDPVNNVLLVSGRPADGGAGGVMIFERTAQGNTKPLRVIRGPRTDLRGGGRIFAHPERGLILVSVESGSRQNAPTGEENYTPLNEMAHDRGYVGVWSIHDSGDVAPRWMIGGPKGMMLQIRGVALDPKNKTVMISDKRLNAVVTFAFPEIF